MKVTPIYAADNKFSRREAETKMAERNTNIVPTLHNLTSHHTIVQLP